jgi:hypothetical protein
VTEVPDFCSGTNLAAVINHGRWVGEVVGLIHAVKFIKITVIARNSQASMLNSEKIPRFDALY